MRRIFLPLLAILLSGATTVSENLSVTVTQQGATGTCPMGNAYADGCPGASVGTIQIPTFLLNTVPTVAGVDYYVGMPQGQALIVPPSVSRRDPQ
jgi:hypothetical protein